MIGVNNRDLKTFNVDISNSERLRRLVPDNVLFIAESGIKTNEDIRRLKEAKVNGVLIGETLMRAKNKKEILDELAKQQKGRKEMSKGRFGIHGGQYVPETLMTAINEVEEAYEFYKNVIENR